MQTEDGRLFQASEFAGRAGVTVRTLHHYDRLGLLRPRRRTPSGYRLYGEPELARLQQIATLKFIGLPLREIKTLLGRGAPLDLGATLRLQREVLEGRRRQLDAALRAVERAERAAARGGGADWEAFRKIIEVINMEHDMEWMKKYYTAEQLADLARRATPEVLEKGQRDWAELIREVEEAVAAGEDPASARSRELAARWQDLIEQFTGGDPGIAESLRRLYADQANWPDTFYKPYPDDVGAFISKAKAAHTKE